MTTPAPAVAVDEVVDERLAKTSLLVRLMTRPAFGAIAGAIALWLFFAWQAGGPFTSWLGAKTYLETAALYGVSALAVGLLMIGGEFDLSSGVVVGTTGMLAAMFSVNVGMPVWLALLLSLLIALAVGALNGLMVIKSRLPSFIVTLGVFFAFRGFNLWLTQRVTGQTNVTGIDQEAGYDLGRKLFASNFVTISGVGFKVVILWFVVLTALGAWLLARTKVGNWIYAVGGNKEAARMVGVPATGTKVGLFMAVAATGWLHGMIVLFDTKRANVTEGVGQEFYYIIAAVLGGCLLTGGLGSLVGVAFGCLILGIAQRGIVLAGWDNNLNFLFLGVILLVAAFVNEAIRRWSFTAARPSNQKADELQAEVAAERQAAARIVGDDAVAAATPDQEGQRP